MRAIWNPMSKSRSWTSGLNWGHFVNRAPTSDAAGFGHDQRERAHTVQEAGYGRRWCIACRSADEHAS